MRLQAPPESSACWRSIIERQRNVFRRAGIGDVTGNEMLETKSRIVEAIAPAATGVLLDHAAARTSLPGGLELAAQRRSEPDQVSVGIAV